MHCFYENKTVVRKEDDFGNLPMYVRKHYTFNEVLKYLITLKFLENSFYKYKNFLIGLL